jgi:hypothetical protein
MECLYPNLCGIGADCRKCYEREILCLKSELETERLRLAACGVAALGYFEGCKDEYRSASLEDVLRLRDENKRLRDALINIKR